MKVGDTYQVEVFSVQTYGVYTRINLHPTVDILVHATEIPEALEFSLSELYKVGDKLQIKIIHQHNETTASAVIIKEGV